MHATPREVFKAYWLQKLASDGLNFNQMLTRVQPISTAIKQALALPTPNVGGTLDTAKQLGVTGLALTAGIGAAGGYSLGRMVHGVKPDEVEDIKHQELMDQYARLTDQAERNKRTKAHKEKQLAGYRGRRIM